MDKKIQDIISESLDVKGQVLNDPKLISLIGHIVNLIVGRFREGRHLSFCGNGGSAADAQHLAAEFSGRFYINRDASFPHARRVRPMPRRRVRSTP